ncbi:DUF4393 domain-containing protein [Klebsiella huaxiensis]|uniref:DUF4393 domain-containing protein n=1 Tax=Klebsiella huaxiensis TaxID=2153354 RepID=UPI002F32B789
MNDDEMIKDTKEVVSALGELVKLAGDNENAKKAADNIGKIAATVTGTVNNILLPLAAVNFAVDKARNYFNKDFKKEVLEATAEIPKEHIQEPKASIVGPAMQGLAYSLDEAELKAMYLKLISSAMDERNNGVMHPAYTDILKQMSSIDAVFMRYFEEKTQSFIRVIHLYFTHGGKTGKILSNYGGHIDEIGFKSMAEYKISLSNLLRLGLIAESEATAGSYDDISLGVIEQVKKNMHLNNEEKYHVKGATLRITALGLGFTYTCIKSVANPEGLLGIVP